MKLYCYLHTSVIIIFISAWFKTTHCVINNVFLVKSTWLFSSGISSKIVGDSFESVLLIYSGTSTNWFASKFKSKTAEDDLESITGFELRLELTLTSWKNDTNEESLCVTDPGYPDKSRRTIWMNIRTKKKTHPHPRNNGTLLEEKRRGQRGLLLATKWTW